MIIKDNEKHLVTASLYIKNAIHELKALQCKCTKENVLDCYRCALIEDTKNIQKDIREEIRKMIN